METSPLFSHELPGDVVAYRHGVGVSAHQFLMDATALAQSMPAGRRVLNVCQDRYRFAVGIAACLLSGRVSLLPSTHTPEVIRRLLEFAADVFCLTDDSNCAIDLPRMVFPTLDAACVPWIVPQIPTHQIAAIVFTSGSTGVPLPFQKTWGRLARCVRDGAPRLGLLDGRRHTLVGTVPAQHMYGFESTVLLALLSGNAFSAERPFYPADIGTAVAAVPRPRALISTPVHLRTLLADGCSLPPVDLIVSATAPLDLSLALDIETRFQSPLFEIYGSTETGQIATRRTAHSLTWTLWPGVRLHARDERVFAEGGHVEQTTAMCDVLEIISDEEFLLHGRTADLVNVAGKRSSFAYLNSQLHAIAGVLDGAFFLRESQGGQTGVSRLAALVVAPTLSAAQVSEQLRQRIDPAFLPRPLLLVERLPRNATGKLPLQSFQALIDEHLKEQRCSVRTEQLEIAADHAAFAGHFPGFPLLPGAVLLDETLFAIARRRDLDLACWRIAGVKFLETVRPGDALYLEHSAANETTIRFTLRTGEKTVASGTLAAIADSRQAVDGA